MQHSLQKELHDNPNAMLQMMRKARDIAGERKSDMVQQAKERKTLLNAQDAKVTALTTDIIEKNNEIRERTEEHLEANDKLTKSYVHCKTQMAEMKVKFDALTKEHGKSNRDMREKVKEATQAETRLVAALKKLSAVEANLTALKALHKTYKAGVSAGEQASDVPDAKDPAKSKTTDPKPAANAPEVDSKTAATEPATDPEPAAAVPTAPPAIPATAPTKKPNDESEGAAVIKKPDDKKASSGHSSDDSANNSSSDDSSD
jgi:hypothetical protein